MAKKGNSPLSFLVSLAILLGIGSVWYYFTLDTDSNDHPITDPNDVELTENNEYSSIEKDCDINEGKSSAVKLPYSGCNIVESVVLDYGKRTVRTQEDQALCFFELMKKKKNCFIVISKKDYYLYVYESQEGDTVMLARYDCAFGLKKGDKTKTGDSRTPHCSSFLKPFYVSEIKNSHDWCHDFGDGRGSIRSYGDFFIRLKLAEHQVSGNNSIGIHGSTNNEETVPGRASEGCIRMKDVDIVHLRKNFVIEGMKVVIKAEDVDDYDFEVKAMQKQKIRRKRHFNPAKTLTNEQIESANAQQGRNKSHAPKSTLRNNTSKNMTIEQIREVSSDKNIESAVNKNKTKEELNQINAI